MGGISATIEAQLAPTMQRLLPAFHELHHAPAATR